VVSALRFDLPSSTRSTDTPLSALRAYAECSNVNSRVFWDVLTIERRELVMPERLRLGLLLLGCVLLVTACPGGSQSGDERPDDWDRSHWDEANWR
jgi:hypothetical protein